MPYLIDFFRNSSAAAEYLDSINDWSYSVMTAMELFAGAKDKREIRQIEKFLMAYAQMPLSVDLGNRAHDIMKNYAKSDGLDPIDAILAATAIANDFTFATRNGKHFRNIEGLRVEIVKYPAASR